MVLFFSVTRKIATYLGEVLEHQRDSLVEHLLANGVDLAIYIMKFQWDMAKYPIKQSLKNIAEIISKVRLKVEFGYTGYLEIVREQMDHENFYYILMRQQHRVSEKCLIHSYFFYCSGSLLVRNLGDLVKKQHFVNGSEYLTTLLVVVPQNLYKDWNLKYEKLTDMVVPRSSELIYEDQDHGLFTVTLFQKVVDEFKLHARENKFIVREFVYNEEELLAGKNEIAKLEHDKKKQFSLLVRWLKVNFSEAFTAWIHVKALRVFVESVLRYGLPVNFQAMLVRPHKKSAKRLREVLNQLYSHLDTSIAQGPVDDIPGLNMGQGEYYPYVFFKININVAEGTGVRL
ncbi:V-type proton ATPase subunit C-like [Limulus polyphemus]|uniref:V-type proton ATPase subunit C n=1 Tax=Limulus polyphemus TaxID=6850 RepID=A0ABM1TME4_LIMPO|nr:V-type proton ATPase subunit C-like [Limulus polyphemus]